MTPKTPSKIENYLFFEGRCEEAIEFYKRAVGAQVEMLMRFKDNPEPAQAGCAPPNSENKIMHASLKIGETRLMVSDGHCSGKPNFQGFTLSIGTKTEAEADHFFAALSEGGKVGMPLTKTFFSPKFGMLTDKFGVMWMVLVQQN